MMCNMCTYLSSCKHITQYNIHYASNKSNTGIHSTSFNIHTNQLPGQCINTCPYVIHVQYRTITEPKCLWENWQGETKPTLSFDQ